MPPITKITKELILEKGLDLVKEKGFEGLNARSLAKKLNCSVQPIFHKFSNMQELKEEIMNKIVLIYRTCMLEGQNSSEKSYRGMGLAYIKFAVEQPKLFQIMFMSEHNLEPTSFMTMDETYKDIEKNIHKANGLEKKEIEKFHLKMWIFTHGLATLIATNTCQFAKEEIEKLLSEEFIALTKLEREK